MKAILTTHDLAVGYMHGKQVTTLLQGLNLTLNEGELVALLGQNGAGKSTLLRALTCAARPVGGSIELKGKDVTEMSQHERSRIIGLVSTERIMAGALTVRELVGLGRQPHTGFLGRMSSHDREIVEAALHDVGIAGKADNYVSELSDGERQKAMIAKALAQETPVIVLDEPTAFLDAASRIETMNLLATLAHDRGKAILLTTHDISRSLLLTDALWLITKERTVVTGPTKEMVASSVMDDVFSSQAVRFNPTTCDYESR